MDLEAWASVLIEVERDGVDKPLSVALQFNFPARNLPDIVRLLLPVSDPKTNKSEALQDAAASGHMEMVRLLLPVCDPRAEKSSALLQAAEFGHDEVVKLLLPVSDVEVAFKDSVRSKFWFAADTISSHVSIDLLAKALAKVPAKEMPQARERLKTERFAVILASSLELTSKSTASPRPRL